MTVVRLLLLFVFVMLLVWIAWPSQPTVDASPELADPGPYPAGWREVSFPRPGSPSTTITALLFYPATSAGQNATFDGSHGPYPALSFGHPFISGPSDNQSLLSHLATYGYFVIATETETGFSPNHSSFAADIRHCLTYLEQQNASSASPYYQKVDRNAFGVFGYSMGGGASILAAAADPRIKVVANLAAAETNPSAIAAAANLTVPMRMLAGSSDAIAPVGEHQQPIYDSARAPKQLAVLQGGYHCGFSDSSFCFVDSGTMAKATQLELTRQWLTAWFNYYLKEDTSLESWVWGDDLTSDSRVVVQFENAAEQNNHDFLPLVMRKP